MKRRSLSVIGFALFVVIVYVAAVHAGVLPPPFWVGR